MQETLDKTTTMDAVDQMRVVADSTTTVLVDLFTGSEALASEAPSLSSIASFRSNVSSRATESLQQLRSCYLSGNRGAAPAALYLGKTRSLYEYVRITLDIRMHGTENYSGFTNGLGTDDVTIGQNISTIYEVSFRL